MAIDAAVSLRLLHWDNNVKKNDAQIMAKAIWGVKDETPESVNSVSADPYADENTQYW